MLRSLSPASAQATGRCDMTTAPTRTRLPNRRPQVTETLVVGGRRRRKLPASVIGAALDLVLQLDPILDPTGAGRERSG